MTSISYFLSVFVFSIGGLANQTELQTNSGSFDKESISEVRGLIKTIKSGLPDGFWSDHSREGIEAQKAVLKRIRSLLQSLAPENQIAGEAFLSANKAKPEVVALESGLQYKIIRNGETSRPGPQDTVFLEYRLTSLNGEILDSTEPGKAESLRIEHTIPGISEALQLMTVGSRWEIYIPASLAYGIQGVGETIEPNQTVVCDIYLVSTGNNR